MKIVKSFSKWSTGEIMASTNYTIDIKVVNDHNEPVFVFVDAEGLATYGLWIEAGNLINKDFLEDHDIKYIVEDDKVIPIGIVNFVMQIFVKPSLPIIFQTIEEQLRYKEIVEQIEKAIKYQYVAQDLRNKCSLEEYTEETEL